MEMHIYISMDETIHNIRFMIDFAIAILNIWTKRFRLALALMSINAQCGNCICAMAVAKKDDIIISERAIG